MLLPFSFLFLTQGNPTRGAFERAMAAAEKSKYCVAYSSGMAAISAVVHLLSSPTRNKILCIDDVYGGTQRYFRKIVQPTMGIQVDFDTFSLCSLESKVTNNDEEGEKKFKLLWLETPTNPLLKVGPFQDYFPYKFGSGRCNFAHLKLLHDQVSDIRAIANLAHEHDCLLAVDNTFCSPYNQLPLELGADIVVHSVTKYINGHSDVVMGVVCVNGVDLYHRLRFIQNGIGAVPSPFDCFLAHRGLKTLHIRMEAAAR